MMRKEQAQALSLNDRYILADLGHATHTITTPRPT